MRKVVAWLFYSLDGAVESPDKWQFDYDEEMSANLVAAQEKQDAVLMGRNTYQDWAGYWPTANDGIGFKHFINNTPKYVASTTLDRVEWQNSTLIKGDVAAEVAKLKSQPGKDIGVYGSPSLVRSLLSANLLDELTLLVHPVFVGSGKKRLIPEGAALTRLELFDAIRGASGTMILSYRPHTLS